MLDFGAARRSVADISRALTGVVKAGYSPHEQYASDSRLQGPWSDLYAFGATLYRGVTGKPPEEATLRVIDDAMVSAAAAANGSYRPGFLSAIDACLKVQSSERPQSVAQLRSMLCAEAHPEPFVETRKTHRPQPLWPSNNPWWVAAAALILVGGAFGALQYANWVPDGRAAALARAVPLPQRPALQPVAMTIRATIGSTTVDGQERGRLGVRIQSVGANALSLFGRAVRNGVLIAEIIAGGPAVGSGLHPLDLVTEIDGVVPSDAAHMSKLIGDRPPGHTVELRLWRLAGGTTEILDGLRRLGEERNTAAQLLLAQLYANGTAVNEDQAEAARWYRKAAEAGDALGMFNLGWMLASGSGVAKDPTEAVRWYRKAAEAGSAQAMHSLRTMLENGSGVAKDATEAVRWYRKAAEAGSAQAMHSLGTMVASGSGVAKDDTEAVRWDRKAAEAGNAQGMSTLGWMLASGNGVTKDDTEAVRWYRKAAEAGDALGMHNLGWMLENGNGVAKDDTEAVRWYRKAAEAGYALGMHNLGLMLAKGRGVAKDDTEAVRWFRKAAEGGEALGMYHLAVMLNDGRGVAPDPKAAAQWALASLRGGNAAANDWMRENPRTWSAEFRRELQRLMKEEGLYAGPIDGDFGPHFLAALDKLKTGKK